MLSTDSWATKYIGTPFQANGRSLEGADCYGLVYLVLLNECGIKLPLLLDTYDSIEDYDRIARAITDKRTEEEEWLPVKLSEAKSFDVIVSNMMGFPMHCGIVSQKGYQLHLVEGTQAIQESYTTGKWRAPNRIVGIYRHRDLA